MSNAKEEFRSKYKSAFLFLEQYKRKERIIENKKAEIERLKDFATNITSNYNTEKVQKSANPDKTADLIVEYVSLENELAEDFIKLSEIRKNITSVIEKLKTSEYDVLHKVYIQGISLDDISLRCGMSYSWASLQHTKAIKCLNELLKNTTSENLK